MSRSGGYSNRREKLPAATEEESDLRRRRTVPGRVIFAKAGSSLAKRIEGQPGHKHSLPEREEPLDSSYLRRPLGDTLNSFTLFIIQCYMFALIS